MSAVPAGSTVGLPSRSEIEGWDTSDLASAGAAWRKAATASEDLFGQHRQNIAAPGGTTWEGDAKDAALDRVTNDIGVVGSHGNVLREAATLAENGAQDIQAAQRKAVEAITEAEDDGFRVGEDLSVKDTRKVDLANAQACYTAAAVHAENIRWNAEQLVQADSLVGERLQTKAVELEGIRFAGEDDHGDGPNHVQLVDNHFKLDPPPAPPPPTPPARGLPPEGVHPPVDGPLTDGPASRPREQRLGGRSLWDEHGGEWRYFPGDDHHNPHWDYNPHSTPSGRGSDWQNVPIGGLPPRKGENPVISGLPPWVQSPAVPAAPAPVAPPAASPAQAPGPGLMPHVNIPAPNPGDLQNAGGQAAVVGGGGLLLVLLGALALG